MSNEDKFYELVKNSSNFGYKDDYYKMRDFAAKLIRENEQLNEELNKATHIVKHGCIFSFEDGEQKFIPFLSSVRGLTHKGQRPTKMELTFSKQKLDEWVEFELQHCLKP